MFNLKPLSRDAVPGALAKAERYRLLNEPGEAESICLDVLEVEPGHPQALIVLLLSLTDQFGDVPGAVHRAHDVAAGLPDGYERAYYSGIVCERRAKAQLSRGGSAAALGTYEWLIEAMNWYEQAETIRPPGIDEAILRWNACARVLMRHPHLQPSTQDRTEVELLE
ncbi:MAG: hypothetical protein LC804_09725 [Acidobacteria bacterium]|nr:hypothetical protein [Acidobacteriota bacterium]